MFDRLFSRRRALVLGGAAAFASLPALGAPSRPNPMPEELRKALERDSAMPVLGNPDGDITLTEFTDYNCSYCRKMMRVVGQLIQQDPKLRVVMRDVAVFGEGSDYAARAGLAAAAQGRYWPYHREMMSLRGRADKSTVLRAARAAGLDVARMEREMANDTVRAAVGRSMSLLDHLGLPGTPSFVTGDEGHFGELSLGDLKEMVARARKTLNG